jgi:flagellar basal-body rod protein FlgF
MIRGLYTAAGSMGMQKDRLDVLANNIANSDTVGYKRDDIVTRPMANFREELLLAMGPDGRWNVGRIPGGTGTKTWFMKTDYAVGQMVPSTNPLDMALEGDGFLVAETENGPRLTRNGSLMRDTEGFLSTRHGQRILGTDGEPILLTGAQVSVAGDGQVESDGVPVGQLAVVRPGQGVKLLKEGSNLYRCEGEWEPAGDCRVVQGMLEKSNVQSILEMIRMMEVMRTTESSQKVIAAYDGVLQKAVNEVGRV